MCKCNQLGHETNDSSSCLLSCVQPSWASNSVKPFLPMCLTILHRRLPLVLLLLYSGPSGDFLKAGTTKSKKACFLKKIIFSGNPRDVSSSATI